MGRRNTLSSTLPVEVELSLTGLDAVGRRALHGSIVSNACRAFSRLGEPVKRVRVHVARVLGRGMAEVWEVAIGVTLEHVHEQRVHARSTASRPHVALTEAFFHAWRECAFLLGVFQGATRATL
jgi:hypothetical protein